MIIALETEFDRLCNLISEDEIRRNPRVKKKVQQMRQTLLMLARLFNVKKKITEKPQRDEANRNSETLCQEI